MSGDSYHPADERAASRNELGRRIIAAAWALSFIWVGTALLVRIEWGGMLAGLGTVILAAQIAMGVTVERVDRFWIVCGAVILAAGLWELLALRLPLAPWLMILLG